MYKLTAIQLTPGSEPDDKLASDSKAMELDVNMRKGKD